MRRDPLSDLYLSGGGAYSPQSGRWVQQQSPQQQASTTGYTYTMDQLNSGWWDNAVSAWWDPGQLGAASVVIQPEWVTWGSRISGLIAASAFTLATLGAGAPAAWAAVGGTWGGAAVGTGVGGAISYEMGYGFEPGAGIGFNIGAVVGGSLPGLFTSSGATLACRLTSSLQGSLVGAGIGGSLARCRVIWTPAPCREPWTVLPTARCSGAFGGALAGGLNPWTCFVAGTQVVVGIQDESGQDLTTTPIARREANVGTLPRIRYRTAAIEELVARGGGERGDGGGQYVMSRGQLDPDGPLTPHCITRTYRRTAYRLRVLTLRDNDGNDQTLRVTEEHPFHIQYAGWTAARNLTAGQVLAGGQSPLTVLANAIEDHPEGVSVYNLEVEAAHTYFVRAEQTSDAEAVWVHNADYSELRTLDQQYAEADFLTEAGMQEIDPSAASRGGAGSGPRGNYATQQQLAQVRDDFLANNPDYVHVAGGRNASTGLAMSEEFIQGRIQKTHCSSAYGRI